MDIQIMAWGDASRDSVVEILTQLFFMCKIGY